VVEAARSHTEVQQPTALGDMPEFQAYVAQERKALQAVVEAARKAVSDANARTGARIERGQSSVALLEAEARASAAEQEVKRWQSLIYASNAQRRWVALQMQRRVLARWFSTSKTKAIYQWAANIAVAHHRDISRTSLRSGIHLSKAALEEEVLQLRQRLAGKGLQDDLLRWGGIPKAGARAKVMVTYDGPAGGGSTETTESVAFLEKDGARTYALSFSAPCLAEEVAATVTINYDPEALRTHSPGGRR